MIRGARGVLRSLGIYRRREHLDSLTRFAGELAPGAALVFDVGAHAGDRVTAFRRRGARVVAVEPQRAFAVWLRSRFALDPEVSVVEAACGPAPGRARLRVNAANPTVSTLSEAFVAAAAGAPGWEGQAWDAEAEVEVTTLDALVARFGTPSFIKVDVEGHEAEVLAGLSTPPPRLAFEVVVAARPAALEALARARALGYRRFRLTLGESHAWATDWIDGAAMAETLKTLPVEANSGDVVAAAVEGS